MTEAPTSLDVTIDDRGCDGFRGGKGQDGSMRLLLLPLGLLISGYGSTLADEPNPLDDPALVAAVAALRQAAKTWSGEPEKRSTQDLGALRRLILAGGDELNVAALEALSDPDAERCLRTLLSAWVPPRAVPGTRLAMGLDGAGRMPANKTDPGSVRRRARRPDTGG